MMINIGELFTARQLITTFFVIGIIGALVWFYSYLKPRDKQHSTENNLERCSRYPPCGKAERKLINLISDGVTVRLILEQAVNKVNPNTQCWFNMKGGKKTGTKYNLLMFAVHYKNIVAFELLIKKGADVSWVNNFNTTILIMISKRGLLDFAEMLSRMIHDKELKQLVNCSNENGWTPLMAATENKKPEMTKWLLNKQADPDASMNHKFYTAFCVAQKKGYKACQKLLTQFKRKMLGFDPRHREIGTNQLAHIEMDKIRSKFHGDGEKGCVAFINITRFKKSKKPKVSNRHEANDHANLQDTFDTYIDCDTWSLEVPHKTKSKIFDFLGGCAKRVNQNGYSYFIIFISSHGGTDSNRRQFFIDSDVERIYCEEIRDFFARSNGCLIEKTPVIPIFTTCRNGTWDNLSSDSGLNVPVIAAKGFTVNATTEGNVAIAKNTGSVAITKLNDMLKKFKGRISIRNWLYITEEADMKDLDMGEQFQVREGENIREEMVYQQFEVDKDTLKKDVEFKLKTPA